MTVSVVGAAAVWDYLFTVDRLPEKGGIVKVLANCPAPYPGGCAPNIATGLIRLGLPGVRLHYPVGKDAVAQGLTEAWAALGIDCTPVQVDQSGYSGAAWQYEQPDGTTMCFAYPGVADAAVPDLQAPLGDWAVIAPVLNGFTLPLLEMAVAEKKQVVLTGIADAAILPYLAGIKALVVNRHEAEVLYGALGKGSIPGLADALGGTLVYVTCGTKGSTVFWQGKMYEVPALRARQTLDVTGAGDAFTAGVVFGLAHRLDPVDAAYVGACCASYVVEAMGGQGAQPGWPAVKERLGAQVPGVLNKLVTLT